MRHLVIISGRSGSGKTVALHALEDLGFYCIDNLPINFLPLLEEAISKTHTKAAVSIDSRNLHLELVDLKKIVVQLTSNSCKVEIIYLDANDDILLQRFSDTRRKHPLTNINSNFTLREAIAKERTLLTAIANLAHFTLDTSKITQHELYILIKSRINLDVKSGHLYLLLQSFGFKYGLPADADFVFDARCLPNPYWHTSLRHLTGLDQEVAEFLGRSNIVQKMQNKLVSFIIEWLGFFKLEHRSYITIALGCTGGRHRSVYLVNKIYNRLQEQGLNLANLQVRHRELHL